MDDDYIIGISNKGILNRSKKDLEKASSIEYSINDDNIEFKIDDIVCNIGMKLKIINAVVLLEIYVNMLL